MTRTARQPNQPSRRNQPHEANRSRRSGSYERAQPHRQSDQGSNAPDTTTSITVIVAAIGALISAATATWSTTWRFAIACAALALPFATALTTYLLVR